MSHPLNVGTVIVICPSCGEQSHAVLSQLSNTNCGKCHQPLVVTGVPTGQRQTALRNCIDCGGSGRVQVDCDQCGGSGLDSCRFCNGKGQVYAPHEYGDYQSCAHCGGTSFQPCIRCGGSGAVWSKCDTCEGCGQLTLEKFDSITKTRQEAARIRAEEEKKKAEEAARIRAEEERRRVEEERRRAEERKKRAVPYCPRCGAEKRIWADTSKGQCSKCGQHL